MCILYCIFYLADDAKIYESINLLNDHDDLQHDIDDLTKWSSDWLLAFNPDKCSFECCEEYF